MVDTLDFFKNNVGKWFTVKEVSNSTEKNLRTVRNNIKDLAKRQIIQKKIINVGGKIGTVTQYQYLGDHSLYEELKEVHHKEQYIRHRQILGDYMSQHILTTILVSEVCKMNEKLSKLVDLMENKIK